MSRTVVTSPGGEPHPVIDEAARPTERKVRFTSESPTFAAAANATVIPPPTAANPRLLLFYTVGSDLEDETLGGETTSSKQYFSHVGQSSNDMRELIRGYAKLNPEERSKVRVLFAFGGALKVGWRGVKYADMDCLVKDGGPGEIPSGEFGDDNCYLGDWPGKSMSDPNTLKDFLVFAKTRYPSVSSVSLVMGDHGAALSGFGHSYDLLPIDSPDRRPIDSPDSQHYVVRKLSVSQIAGAISQSGIQLGLLGFDACLMGNLETAYILRNSARFLVASAELEPGHGWSYHNFMRHFVESDSLAVFARKVIDDYAWLGDSIQSDVQTGVLRKTSHFHDDGKILALVDLSKTEALYQKWTTLVSTASASLKNGIYELFVSAKQYNYRGGPDETPYVDMSQFALAADTFPKSNTAGSGLAGARSDLRAAINDAVIYVASDNSIGPDTSISAINPLRSNLFDTYNPAEFADNADLPAEWRQLAVRIKTEWALYKVANPAPRFARRVKDCKPARERNDAQPYACFQLPPPSKLMGFGAGFEIKGKLLGRIPLTADGKAYGMGAAAQSWLALCDGPCARSTNFLYLPLNAGTTTIHPDGLFYGSSQFVLNGRTVNMSINYLGGMIDGISFSYEDDDTPTDLVAKRPDITLRAGDTISARGETIVLKTSGYVGYRPLPPQSNVVVYPVVKFAFEESWKKLAERQSLLTNLAFAGTAGQSKKQECAGQSWSHLTIPPVNDCKAGKAGIAGIAGCVGTRELCLFGQDSPSDGILTDVRPQKTPCGAPYTELSSYQAIFQATSGPKRAETIRLCGLKENLANQPDTVVTEISIPGAGSQSAKPAECVMQTASDRVVSAGTMPDCFKAGAKFCKGIVNLCVRLRTLSELSQ